MDLMPCNIAWKEGKDGNIVHIKVLDFDAATHLPFRIGDKLQALTLSGRREYMWRERLFPNVRFDWWYCFLYSKIPKEGRCFANVSGELSPQHVNGPFIDWLESQEVNALRDEFDSSPFLHKELDLSNW